MQIDCNGFSKNGNTVTINFNIRCSEISDYQKQYEEIEEMAQKLIKDDKLMKFHEFYMDNGGYASKAVVDSKEDLVTKTKVHIDKKLEELTDAINKFDPRKKASFSEKAQYENCVELLEKLKSVCKDGHIKSDNFIKNYKSLVNDIATQFKKDREDMIHAFKALHNNPVVTQLADSNNPEEPMSWLLVEVGGKRATGNDHTFARWFKSFEAHMNRWMNVNINNELYKTEQALADLLVTGAKINDPESIYVHEFITSFIGLQGEDLKLREGDKLLAFAYAVSPLGRKVEEILPKMNGAKKKIDTKIDQIMEIAPEFKPESLMCVNNINVKDFLSMQVKELITNILCDQENNRAMPDVNYVSYKMLKRIDPQVAKKVTEAGEVFISKTIDESKYLKDLHSVVKALPHQKGMGLDQKTHMIVGISSPGSYNWDIGPFLSKFCDSYTRKEIDHSILMNPDIPGFKAQKICSVDYNLKFTEMRKFK